MKDFYQPDIICNGMRCLQPEQDRRPTTVLCGAHIRSTCRPHNQIAELFKPPVPLTQVADQFWHRLVIGDGYMHRIHAAFAHLAKHFFREVGVLQPIDQVRHGRTLVGMARAAQSKNDAFRRNRITIGHQHRATPKQVRYRDGTCGRYRVLLSCETRDLR